MVTGKREFVVGLIRDQLFGPVVMFGLGGIFTEALHDVAFAVAPLSEEDAYELLDQIEAKVLLGPFRGSPAVDREALAAIIKAVGQMAEDHPEIREIDVNPLLIDGADAGGGGRAHRGGRAGGGLHPAAGRHLPPGRAGGSAQRGGGGRLGRHGQVGRHAGGQPAAGRFPGPDLSGQSQGRDDPGPPRAHERGRAARDARPGDRGRARALVNGVVEECGRKGVRRRGGGLGGVLRAGPGGPGAGGRDGRAPPRSTAWRWWAPTAWASSPRTTSCTARGSCCCGPSPGGASMVSQSGNLGTQLLVSAERRKGGVGKFIGVGNEAMIDAVDFINYLHTDPQTNTIVAYMEGFDDGRRLLDVVRADHAGEAGGGAARRHERLRQEGRGLAHRGADLVDARSSRRRPGSRG